MTEEKRKRRFWKRGPRRKKAGEEHGTPAVPDESGISPPQEADRHSGGDEPPGEAAAAEAEGERGAGTVPDFHEVAEEVASRAGGKKSRHRSRRRGRGKKTSAAEGGEKSASTPEGEAVRAEPQEPGDAGEQGDGEPGEAAESGGTADPAGGAESAGEERKGRRRGRRRRRRKKVPAAEEGKESADVAAEEGPLAAAETFEGAEGTLSEEAAPRTGEEEPEEAEEEAGEEGAPEAKGAKKVMLIDGAHPEEIRVAILREGVLEYFEVENQRRKLFKGNIYKAKVVNVAQAIEAAFVDFGGGRHGFLPLNEYCGGALIENLETWNEGDKRPHLRPGTEILVQVTKEESPIKGAAVTSYISIAGRYLVMMLGMKRYGISKKITGEKERERIRKNMEKLSYPDHLGFIVRTVGAGQPLKDLRADLTNLVKLWNRTVEGARAEKAPALLYEEQDIVVRALRDNYSSDIAEVFMDSPDSHRKASDFFDVYYPKQKDKLKLYRQKRPLFFRYNLEEQIERICLRKVPLPSGGHILIDRSEALWSIDVNSGRSARDRDIEDTAFRTNKEAAAEVARQLRIRDMGGLIVVDFIDMEHRNHNKEVERILKEGLKRDKAKTDVTSLGKFGLVAISRQRMGISFYDVLLKGCDLCAGTGSLPTLDATVVKLMRRVHSDLSREAGKEIVVRVSPPLLEAVVNQKREEITRLEKLCGSRVSFVADASLPSLSFSVTV
ncbi:MAG: Rne/Rng family ribonuclease [Deltaproteobacteria bacterium]|nr:MAG: Rne/Rng family ribonuclease [Deltaproteobacteria bacterium]